MRSAARRYASSALSASWRSRLGNFQLARFSTGAPSGDGEADSHDDFKPTPKSPAGSVHDMIEKDVKDNPVMVYMKGIPDAPQCGFSAMVVKILKHYEVPFSSRNVLEDPELREGVKSFSKWPTIPQVYIQGEFVGGCDIVTNMHRSGELKDKLKTLNPDLQ